MDGKHDGERRSSPELRLHLDLASVGLDDLIADGESEPAAHAHVFRRESGLEELVEMLGSNAAARVRESNLNAIP